MKGYRRGVKYYRPFVRYFNLTRGLRRTFRTASGAVAYGQVVAERYQRRCEYAVQKTLAEIQADAGRQEIVA